MDVTAAPLCEFELNDSFTAMIAVISMASDAMNVHVFHADPLAFERMFGVGIEMAGACAGGGGGLTRRGELVDAGTPAEDDAETAIPGF
ncbi:hypothetical protein NS14008_24240 [Nocardia seriolae]|nr:hypothetical protein NS14008_24240 [Nocardia seriolae]